jgi:hypothetical protein
MLTIKELVHNLPTELCSKIISYISIEYLLDNESSIPPSNIIDEHNSLRFDYFTQYGFWMLLNQIEDYFPEISSNRKMKEERKSGKTLLYSSRSQPK